MFFDFIALIAFFYVVYLNYKLYVKETLQEDDDKIYKITLYFITFFLFFYLLTVLESWFSSGN